MPPRTSSVVPLALLACSLEIDGPFLEGSEGVGDGAHSSSTGSAPTDEDGSPPGDTTTAPEPGDDGSATTSTTTTTDGTETGADTEGSGCRGYDENGVAQIYCTDPAGAPSWVLGFDDWEDRISQFGEVSGDGVQTIVEESGQVRMSVAAEDFECEGLQDHGVALEQGYMCTPLDWTDYEMTGYFQLVDAASDDGDRDFTMYGGGGRHTGDGPPEGCLGSAYKGSYHYADAQVRFGKESWHVNYDYRDGWIDVDGGPDLTQDSERWIGMKVVRYRFEEGGEPGIRNELWLDLGGVDEAGDPANDWQLATTSDDHPNAESWGSDATECDAPADDQIMFWGGPHVTWRWDGTTARLRLMSVREIVAPI